MKRDKEAAPSPLSLRDRRREQTRQEIVASALEIISSEGVDAATIERLASHAGMSRGTVYAHFEGGRDEILREAYRRIGSDLVAAAESLAAAGSTWRERVLAYARPMVLLAEDPHRGHFYNVAGPALADGRTERGRGSSATLDAVRDELLQGQSQGAVDEGVDATATAILLVGSLREAGIELARGAVSSVSVLSAFELLLAGLERKPVAAAH